ncbi:MAG: isocitrate/isopropylmalate family dehydrogenase, partial [Anaerovoracaceae bacterium]
MEYLKAFETIVKEQLERVERMKSAPQSTDYKSLDKIIVGIIDGDGIGPIITQSCKKIMEHLLADEIAAGKIELRDIEGLTIENRVEKMETVPADVLAAVKECHVLLKGPTMTPGKGDNMPNLESANVKLRKELDLFANVRPVSIPEKNINWTFFRENTEGEYA